MTLDDVEHALYYGDRHITSVRGSRTMPESEVKRTALRALDAGIVEPGRQPYQVRHEIEHARVRIYEYGSKA